ncbi:MAG: xanthine dehydrogenase family protein molybdopterin-binding subunit [Hyphomicrobiales bacterium]|nr:xanthine dehydrogenase family protein molybdopterin-binding subunit [Hyphomicrobiales bacterium]
MTGKRSLTRRIFLIGSAAIGGTVLAGLGLGIGYLSTVDVDGLDAGIRDDGTVDLSAWINIAPDNTITIYVPFLEMGQGTHTGLGQLVAEELGLDLNADNVRVTHPSVELSAHSNWTMILNERPEQASGPFYWLGKRVIAAMGMVATGGSTAMVGNWTLMRQAGAVARETLKAAAAKELGEPPSRLLLGYARYGTADGKDITFGELATKAAKETPPTTGALKPANQFEVIGQSLPRKDIPAKVAGRASFGFDIRLDGMLFAALHQAPQFGAKLAKLEESDIRSRRGIVEIVKMEDAVAVVADNSWRALEALAALDVTWTPPPTPVDSTAAIDQLRVALEAKPLTREVSEGDVAGAITRSMRIVEAVYETPYLAHATMEPMNTTILWANDGSVEVWSPTQSSSLARAAVAKVEKPKRITVHVTFAGGGFGRRAETDFVFYAAKVAHALKGRPVQTFWSREEDMRHDAYRPAALARMVAATDGRGRLDGLQVKLAAASLSNSYMARNVGMNSAPDSDAATLEGVLHTPYRIKSRSVGAVDLASPVFPLGYWRSVGHSNNAFFMEAFIDECAHADGIDPAEFRLNHLDPAGRHAAVLKKLIEVSHWTGPGGNGRGRGLALHESFRGIVGAVLDIAVDGKTVNLQKAILVADCGTIINPQLVEMQMQGGFLFGLTAAIHGRIDVVDGAVDQSNFLDYQMLTLAAAPPIDVHLMPSGELPSGVGEPGTPPAAPALVNAIFAATGERVRTLPISDSGYSLA